MLFLEENIVPLMKSWHQSQGERENGLHSLFKEGLHSLFMLGLLWSYLLCYISLLELNLHSDVAFACVRSDIYQIHSILSTETNLQQFIFVQ